MTRMPDNLTTREDVESREEALLAPYAVRGSGSLGRLHPESPHPYRTAFQRDRDRITYSRCFRRLEYKTQVFINGTADHYRTRLTHTFEMTAVGRTIARALGANEDLTEAITLAHDIGHSPFGHAGERELDALMRDHGGFNHNTQSLRWVEMLEPAYPHIPGLNLTWEVRAGLRKHQAADPGRTLDDHPIGPFQQVEAQIADIADDISYYAHDVQDALESGLLTEEALQEVPLWRRAQARAVETVRDMPPDFQAQATTRCLLDLQVEDVIQTSLARLQRHAPASPADVMRAPERMVEMSPELQALIKPHRDFLFRRVYWHPAVEEANRDAVRMMRGLFEYYLEHPETMGRKARARIPHEGLWRTACDYVSGMTDRYAIDEYRRFGLDSAPPASGETP